MKSCFYQYRKGIYDKLSGLTYDGDEIPVYQYPPPEAEKPYILIGEMDAMPLEDKDLFSQEVTTELHAVTESGVYGSSIEADGIINEVMQTLIAKGTTDRSKFVSMDDFTQTTCALQGQRYANNWDGEKLIIRNIVTINAKIDEQ
jgi:hypothetical protein